jgi:hypothetical protein
MSLKSIFSMFHIRLIDLLIFNIQLNRDETIFQIFFFSYCNRSFFFMSLTLRTNSKNGFFLVNQPSRDQVELENK